MPRQNLVMPDATGPDEQLALISALELLIDALQIESGDLRAQLHQQYGLAALAATVADLADRVAESRWREEMARETYLGFFGDVAAATESLDKVLQNTVQQTQATFQSAQKTGEVLERQVQDIGARLNHSDDVSTLRSWAKQRLAIIQARLDDYQEQGAQGHVLVHGQMQKLVMAMSAMRETAQEHHDTLLPQLAAGREDALARTGNRLAAERALRDGLESWEQGEAAFVVAVCDVDGLSRVRGRHGTEAAGKTLMYVAALLQRELRDDDLVARLGSDEFLILLPNTAPEDAAVVIDRLCRAVEEADFHSRGKPVYVTISAGYTGPREGDTPVSMLTRARAALNDAKAAGRNCIRVKL